MKDIKYFDTHSHINIDPLYNEINEIVDFLKSEKTITNSIGVDIESSIISIELSKKYEGVVYPCVGIHPIDGEKYYDNLDETILQLEKIILEHKDIIVAIGEIGLDYYNYNDSKINKEKQIELFKKQLELAEKYKLPVNIHNRNSDDDLLEILKNYQIEKVMIHCFSASIESAKKFIDKGYYLSIPGIATFKNAHELKEAINYIPIDKLVSETDSPFLTPVPHRGKVNKPHYVKYVVNEIANIKKMDFEETRKIILNNSLEFFNIKSR